MNVIYFGLFIEQQDLPTSSLAQVVEHPHVTFAFRPDEVPAHLIGKMFDLSIVSEGNDGINEGLGVRIPDELKEYYRGASIPHITLSIAEGALNRDTAFIEYSDLDQPVTIPSTMKLFTAEGII